MMVGRRLADDGGVRGQIIDARRMTVIGEIRGRCADRQVSDARPSGA
jgi:hypothetical protein